MLRWKDEYLQSGFPACRLVLGKSLLGTVSLDLNLIPHVLLGGGTGSGKSVLLKLIWPQLAQTPKLQANPRPRRFDSLLDSVSEKLKQRKDLLGKAGCTNTYEYHRRETLPMDCIVLFAVEDSVQHGRERPDSARRPRPFPHG